MRNITKKGKKEVVEFKCFICGEEWESNEFRRELDGLKELKIDHCETCGELITK